MLKLFQKARRYRLPYGWSIAFPNHWTHEKNDNEDVFYPSDSDLTVRITPIHIERDGVPAPHEMLADLFLQNLPEGAERLSPDTFGITASSIIFQGYVTRATENGETVYQICIGCCTPGNLLLTDLFSTSKENCLNALPYLRTVQKK